MAERVLAALLAFASMTGSCALACAQAADDSDETEEAPTSSWDRDWALHWSLGLGTPVGLIGMQLERRVASWLALQAGCGLGVHPQLAATARLRIPEAPAFNLGIGVSGGRYKQVDCYLCFEGSPFTMRWDPAVWNNYEVSVEHRARGPFTLRASLGLAALLNRDSVEVACDSCSPDRRPPAATRVLGFGGIAIGATF